MKKPTAKEDQEWKKAVDEKLAHFSQIEKVDWEAFQLMARNTMRAHAGFLALLSVVRDVAARLSLPRPALNETFEARKEYYLDRLLSMSQDQKPEFSAMMDDRALDEIPTERGLPHLPWKD